MHVGVFLIQSASLIHLVCHCASLATTSALSQSMTWFCTTAWSVMTDLWVTLLSLAWEARICVPAVKESTSFRCSFILRPSFLPVLGHVHRRVVNSQQVNCGGDKSCKAPVKSSPTNQHPVFYRPDALPVAQPTMSKHWREKYHIPWTRLPQAHLEVFQLCLWPLIAPGYLGEGCHASHQPSDASTPMLVTVFDNISILRPVYVVMLTLSSTEGKNKITGREAT